MAKVQPITEQPEDFWQQLARLNEGHFYDDVEDELSNVLEGVRYTGKKGSVTIKLDVEVVKGGAHPQITVTPTVTGNRPKQAGVAKTFFIGEDNRLHRSHPNQTAMFD